MHTRTSGLLGLFDPRHATGNVGRVLSFQADPLEFRDGALGQTECEGWCQSTKLTIPANGGDQSRRPSSTCSRP